MGLAMAKYVIWDFDGTLAEREGMWTGTLIEAAALESVSVTREAIRPFLQSGFPWHTPQTIRPRGESADAWWDRLDLVFVRALTHGAGIDQPKAATIARHIRVLYTEPRRWRVYEDVLPCLAELSNHGCQHVILSNHVPELEQLVTALGLRPHFAAVFSSAQTGIEKPNIEAFRLVQAMAGPKAKLWMVGDSWQADVCGATGAGIRGILVRKSHTDAKLCCPDLVTLPTLLGSS